MSTPATPTTPATSAPLDWWNAYPPPQPAPGTSHVRVNFISSADGSVTLDGRSGGLGGPADRELMRVLRTLSDVVLVGAGTVRAEGYGGLNLPTAFVEQRAALGLSPTPRIAIVSGSLDLTPDMSIFTKAEERPLIITHAASPAARREALSEVADVLVCGSTAVDLTQALTQLASFGLSRVLCEGGPTLFGSLLDANLVDEVCLTVSPMFVAGPGARIAHSVTAHPRKFGIASMLTEDDFLFLRYARK